MLNYCAKSCDMCSAVTTTSAPVANLFLSDDSSGDGDPVTTSPTTNDPGSGYTSTEDTAAKFQPPTESYPAIGIGQTIRCGRKALLARVVGGKKAPLGSWPWQVGIKSCTNCKFFCGGTIIGKKWVLTAAHCVNLYRPHELVIEAGVVNQAALASSKQAFKCKEIHVHENYGVQARYDQDIAVLKLDNDVVYNDHVRPLCLNDQKLKVNQRCVVTGFGKIHEHGLKSDHLKQTSVPVVAWENCTKSYRSAVPPRRVTNNMFCAGFASGGIDACGGDSGGPLSCYDRHRQRYVLGGIVSWGVGCGRAHRYGVYTDVQRFVAWVRKIAKI